MSYVFIKTFSGNTTILVPTLLVILIGFIKYVERSRALFLASLENLKDSVGQRLIHESPEEDISLSYYYYERFRGMVTDVMPSPL